MNSATLFSIPVVLSPLLTEAVLHPRSPGRSRRRAAMGHKQHTIQRPMRTALKMPDGALVMHPDTYAALRR